MEATLVFVDAQISLWESSVEKIVAHLSSITNLLEQQGALKRGKLGVLSQHHDHLTSLLEMKLMQSMERTLGLAHREKETLTGVVRKLRKCAKEGQAVFETSVTKHGLVYTCRATPEAFSTADGAHWCRQLYSAYKADLESKERSLQDLEYSNTRLSQIISVWEKYPEETRDTLQHLRYTIKKGPARS